MRYAPDDRHVCGTIRAKGKTALIGDPPPAVADALGRLWQKEWRSGPG